MLNNVIIVGRLVKNPELQVTDNGKKVSIITLAVGRAYKNVNGEYDTDFIDCTLWTNIAENTAEYCKSGDIIGVKGRLQTRIVEKEDGSKYKKTDVIADKVSFLSSAKSIKENEKNVEVTADNSEFEVFEKENSADNGRKVTKVDKKKK